MLSSICFMPASLTPQSLPPFVPTMSMYLSDSTVVTCMRAGLYQTKKGLLVFFGSLRSRKSITLAEVSSSTVFDRSRVKGPSSLQDWFASVPSEEWHQITGRGGVRQVVVLGSTAPGTSERPGIGLFLHGGAIPCSVEVLLMSGKLTPCIASRWYSHPNTPGNRAPSAGTRRCRRGGFCRTHRWCSRDRVRTRQAPGFPSATKRDCRVTAAGSC